MKNYKIIIWLSFLVLLVVNSLIFKNLYELQINQHKNLLFKQSDVCSDEIARVVQKFESDLNYILFSDDIANIFVEENSDGLRKLQLFYSTYNDLIVNIDIYDNKKNVHNLFRDKKKNFITDRYIAQRQRKLSFRDEINLTNSEYQYILPVFENDSVFANIVVTINLNDYIISELNKFHLKDLTWQWVIDLDNNQVFNSLNINYSDFEDIDEMVQNLNKDLNGMLIHRISNDSLDNQLLTVYSPIKLIGKHFGIAMSIDYKTFLTRIFKQLSIISSFSILLFLAVALFLSHQIKELKKKIKA